MSSAGRFDVVVIGSGAGGGTVAGELARGGRRVLVVERGRSVTFAQVGRDPLRNHRIARYPVLSGPDLEGTPRVFSDRWGKDRLVWAHEEEFNDNATMVGGGTRVYGAQAWRLLPEDFRMRSRYGEPRGSTLADWPFGYAELEPYYRIVEAEVGVSGDSIALSRHWNDASGYPMPALHAGRKAAVLRAGAEKLGWSTSGVPLLINSVARDGRAACIRCEFCVGFACPVEAKAGTHNTSLANLPDPSLLEVRADTIAAIIEVDGSGRARSVACIDERTGRRYRVEGDIVVCAGGAIETARLLLNSAHSGEPQGIGNAGDLVGRNLQGHVYASSYGRFPDQVRDGLGPGVSIATLAFNHDNPGVIGGSVLVDDFTPLPFAFWDQYLPPTLRRWGAENSAWVQENYTRTMRVAGPVQEIPLASARVRVSHEVRDRWGLPVARLSGGLHPETLRTAHMIRDRAAEWLRASGAVEVWQSPLLDHLSGGQHQAGTCRMGEDPSTSVVDPWGRVHGYENLWVADGSTHVTNGGVNPVLTIMALARRTADRIVQAAR